MVTRVRLGIEMVTCVRLGIGSGCLRVRFGIFIRDRNGDLCEIIMIIINHRDIHSG